MPTKNWGATGSVLPGVNDTALVILLHQLLFQGMFLTKNVALRRKLGQPIRGSNREANLAIACLALFIGLALLLAFTDSAVGRIALLPGPVAMALGLSLLAANLLVGLASLRHLGDSWRVGVIDGQRTELVQDGIYGVTRNPYFFAYLLMCAAYTILLQNLVLLFLALVCFALIHAMILREERHLAAMHGEAYHRYRQRVGRYLLF
jgi:protein-S-isoprenylcysteine O-methyltransferase Ste14